MTGYLKTVVKGYTIEKIPVTVTDIVELSWGNLILAEASGPVIDEIGGVASGMSGSPVYVDDGGVDKLVGALSYGERLHHRRHVHGDARRRTWRRSRTTTVKPPATGTYKLAEPVQTDGGRGRAASSSPAAPRRRRRRRRRRVSSSWRRSASSRSAASRRRPAPTRSSPRSSRSRPASRWWPPSGGPLAAPTAPPLEGGSSIFQLFSQGSVWYGSAGTATYVNGDVVVAYGHPAWWTGPCGAAMAGGYVSAIWPSQWAPFKLIAPRDIKGTIVQDRNWGIAGIVGQDPDMVPVTSTVTFPEQGGRDRLDRVHRRRMGLPDRSGYQDLAGYLVMQALWDACDLSFMPGSADDDDDHRRVRRRRDAVHGGRSTTSGTRTTSPSNRSLDVIDTLWMLGSDPDGVLDVRLDSVDFQATISTTRTSGRLVDIALPNGLKTGDNIVRAQLLRVRLA